MVQLGFWRRWSRRHADRQEHSEPQVRSVWGVAGGDEPLRVLEVGAGIGTMVTRVLEWDILPTGNIHYTAVDLQPGNVAELSGYIRNWAEDRAVSVADNNTLTIETSDRRVEVETARLETLLATLDVGGLYYFPITGLR